MKKQQSCFVIKCGGSTLEALPDTFYVELKRLQEQGHMPVIVHGGGPAISATLHQLNIETQFVNGLRRTTEPVLDAVEMVLSGRINKQIVRLIQKHGAQAIGLSGIDGQLLEAEPVVNADEVGYVGQVTTVNVELLQQVMAAGYMPIIAPLGIDRQGQRYNINADTAAGAVASQLGVKQMIVVTDVPGIMKKIAGEQKVLPAVTRADIERMIEAGDIYGGMIPKVQAAMQCLQGQVQEVVIVDGAEPDVLTKVLQGENIGTKILKEGRQG